MKSPSILAAVALLAGSHLASAATVVFSDTFSYADGALVGASGSPWATTSGTAGQVDVAGGTLNITGTESEDVNAALTGGAYTTGTVTATFNVTFTALPTSTTTYFAHFLNSSSVFRGKVFSTLTGAAAGTFRIGLSNNVNSPNQTIATDLSLNTSYLITLIYDLDTMTSSLSINNGTAVVASDSVTAVSIAGFGFRQSTGIGTMVIDNLSVSVPEPAVAMLGGLGVLGLLRRRRF